MRRLILLCFALCLMALPLGAQTPAPAVSWTTTVSGPAPATVTIDVTVDAAGGTPLLVECFNGQIAIGVDDTFPYRAIWPDVPSGAYDLYCTVQVQPAAVLVAGAPTPVTVVAAADYSSFPLLKSWSEVAAGYVGCFRVPPGLNAMFNYAGYGLTWGGDGRLFLARDTPIYNAGAYTFPVAEIQEPAVIVPSATVAGCPVATIVQQTADAWEGKQGRIADPPVVLAPGHTNLWGLLVIGNQLCFSGGINYDALNSGKRSHFCRSKDLSARGTVSDALHIGNGTYQYTINGQIFRDEKPGYCFGYMNWIPLEWRPVIGADVACGGTGKNITLRQSQGPSFTAFNSADLAARMPNVPAQFLVNYPFEQQQQAGERMLGMWQSSALPAVTAWHPEYQTVESGGKPWLPVLNPDGTPKLAMPLKPLSIQYGGLWNGTGQINGFAWGNKSRTLIVPFGMGIGEWCYKDCPTHPVNPTTSRPDGTTIMGGHHAEPNTYRVFFYDALDLVKVKAGELKPWKVMPYHVENITLPGAVQNSKNIRGVAHDARTNRLYLAVFVDRWTTGGGYVDSPPMILVYQLPTPK